MTVVIKNSPRLKGTSIFSRAKTISSMLDIIDTKGDTSILHPIEMQTLEYWREKNKSTYRAEGSVSDLEELGRIMYACCS